MNADVVLLNPSYIYPPFGPGLRKALYGDALVMDLPTSEFLYPPIGLLSISGALKRDGFSVVGIDSNTEQASMEELAARCEGAKVVGISLLVANLRSVYQLVHFMKGRGYEVVVGGAYPTVEPEVVAKLGLKYGIAGEGEESFVQLCRALVRGEGKPEDIPGIIIAEEGKAEVYTKESVLLESLNDWLPDRSLIRDSSYRLPFTGRLDLALASRGCPYKCTFCYCSSASPNSMFNKSRWVDVDVIVQDIKHTLETYKPSYIELIDETFTVNRKYVLRFCQAIKDQGLQFDWGAKTRIDLMDDELMEAMASAGMKKIGFGLESGVYDHRLAMKKDFSNEKVVSVFDSARRFGVESACTIIFGHPDETPADMQASVDFVKAIRADYVEFHIMVLVPKTQLFYQAVREGKVEEDVFDRFMRGEITYPEYSPGDLTPDDMRQIHSSAIRQFYFRPRYFAQTLRRVRKFSDLMQYTRTAKGLFKMSEHEPVWKRGRSRI
jgi:anaerobic magnesium-protoporphyrin IX monomethyl ester cyclase